MVGWYVVFRDVVIMCLCCLVLLAAAVKKNTSINMIKKTLRKFINKRRRLGSLQLAVLSPAINALINVLTNELIDVFKRSLFPLNL